MSLGRKALYIILIVFLERVTHTIISAFYMSLNPMLNSFSIILKELIPLNKFLFFYYLIPYTFFYIVIFNLVVILKLKFLRRFHIAIIHVVLFSCVTFSTIYLSPLLGYLFKGYHFFVMIIISFFLSFLLVKILNIQFSNPSS